jgi:hypothetical protein
MGPEVSAIVTSSGALHQLADHLPNAGVALRVAAHLIDLGLRDASPDHASGFVRHRVEHERPGLDDVERGGLRRERRQAPLGDGRQELPQRLRLGTHGDEQVVMKPNVRRSSRRGGEPAGGELARDGVDDGRAEALLDRGRVVLGAARHLDVAGLRRVPGPGAHALEVELLVLIGSYLDLGAKRPDKRREHTEQDERANAGGLHATTLRDRRRVRLCGFGSSEKRRLRRRGASQQVEQPRQLRRQRSVDALVAPLQITAVGVARVLARRPHVDSASDSRQRPRETRRSRESPLPPEQAPFMERYEACGRRAMRFRQACHEHPPCVLPNLHRRRPTCAPILRPRS